MFELSGERLGGNLEIVSVNGCRGFSFSGRGISEVGGALGTFCANRMRSWGSRGAEEQELLVQDVELDLTGTANMNSLHARQCLFPDSAGRIHWGVALMSSCFSWVLLFHVRGGKTGKNLGTWGHNAGTGISAH